MKPPISYYGGKQNMLVHLLPLIPKHETYVEPFFGGGALFFAKNPAPLEVINDTNELIINFYRQMVINFDALNLEIKATMHSRASHFKAGQIIKGKVESTDLEKAWAVYVSIGQGFGNVMGSGWGYEKSVKSVVAVIWNSKRTNFINYKDRLQDVQIDCQDALKVIKLYDSENTLFYCDTPYYNSDCGHYKGYTEDNYKELIDLLLTIKGKFILSSYPNPVIDSMQWIYRNDIVQNRAVNAAKGATKIETIITNYLTPQLNLF
jgi:DNA adenine methylase